jgi:Lambda phage tail tube protein, TTP
LAVNSQGTTFEVEKGLGSPTEWWAVDGVTNIRDLRSGTAAEIDTTDLSSTAKEFELGLKDEGSMSLDVINNPVDPGQKRLAALRSSRAVGQFRIICPFGSPNWTLTFNGLVTTFPATFAVDDVVRGTVGIRVTGEIIEST